MTDREEAYWQQQQQIDHYERILDGIRAYRDGLIEYSKDLIISGPAVATIANGVTRILEEEE